MNFKVISMALYATYVTNKYGLLLKGIKNPDDIMRLRLEYAKALFSKLNISVKVVNKDKIPTNGNYVLVSNHRSIIDPLIIELAFGESDFVGYWVAKKELYNSFFFGLFVRNAGTILLDREADSMSAFFKETKEIARGGKSIYIFPEGTRNKENTLLSEFKEGSKIVALKNRLPILPVYIRSNSASILKEAIRDRTKGLEIEFEIGDPIDYKSKIPLEETYRNRFNLF